MMELTAAQRQVVEAPALGRLRVVGGPGHGKTTALVARYLRLIRGQSPSSVLVVCRNRPAADRFREAVLPALSGGFDALPITTWFGVAFDLVTRTRGEVRLLSGREQRGVVRRLLATESAADWPILGRYLGRAAFADEVAAAVLEFRARTLGRAARPGTGPWPELAGFAARYGAELAGCGQVDAAGLLAEAARAVEPGHHGQILVDDLDQAGPGELRLLGAMAGPTAGFTATMLDPPTAAAPGGLDVALPEAFRRPPAPALVACRHPSMEPEAVAGELLAARAEGVAWSGMAVLVRRQRQRGRAVARALGRHGIPVTAAQGLGSALDDPAVAAIVDVLRWADGDASAGERLPVSPLAQLGPAGLAALRDDVMAAGPTGRASDLAFLVWQRGLGHLADGDPRHDLALDAIVAFLDRVDRPPARSLGELVAALDDGGLDPDPWRLAAGGGRDAVTVTSIADAGGREWHTVVVAGCVEGDLPRVRGRTPLFDPALLDAENGTTLPTPAERRRASVADERRLFELACNRATDRLVATAAPEPGVLLSRFVEDWAPSAARLPEVRGLPPVRRRPTHNPVAVFPDGVLTLSASQLDVYDDCPLRYAYQYGLRVRDDAGAPAALGSLVHAVLQEFLDPARPPEARPRSRDALLALAAEMWTDDIARYRPQVEECRRDYYSMLEAWWAVEGEGARAPEVLAVERRFDVEVGDVRLVGFIDRVDRSDDGAGVRIVDYKTGRHEPRPDAMPDDLQLAVYHLAAERDPVLTALGPPRQLRLLYLRTMHVYEQPVLEGHAAATEARILDAAARIRAEAFEPSVDASCRTCSFHRLCPLQPEGREVGVG